MAISLRQRLTIYDLYERHTVASRLLRTHISGDPTLGTVLDVGGRRGLLSSYCSPSQPITTINPDGTGDLVGGGAELPFADGQFEAVVTLDTLEHMPKDIRHEFLTECLRVANGFLLVAAPFGSPDHIRREEAINEKYHATHGYYHEYLNEHVRYGLPTLDELSAYRRSLPCADTRLYFASDFVWQADAFERSLYTANLPRPLSLPLNVLQRLSASALLHRINLRTEVDSRANRFYLVLHKM